MTKTPPEDHGQDYWRSPVTLASSMSAAEVDADQGGTGAELERMAEFMPTLCWIARGDASIFWYNKRWHDYCGTTPAEMEGWGWQSVHDPAYLPEVLRKWRACIETAQPFEMTFPLRGADGVFRPFLTRAVPVRDPDGRIVRWFGVNTEIGAQLRAEKALEQVEAKYEVLTNAMPQMVWSALPDGYHDYYNAQWYAFTGMPVGSTDGEAWNGMFHPDDQERAWACWRHSLATGEEYDIEYRLRHHSGDYRWVLGRAYPVRDEQGGITRWIGTCTDIDQAKRASEQNELLSRELSHRIKNIFAVISGLVSLTATRVGALKPAMGDLLGRISALGTAHDFARPHSPHSLVESMSGSLQGLISQLLTPYTMPHSDRILVRGDDIRIDDQSATPIALVIHELATNSAKYGALSAPVGKLTIDISREGDDLSIAWGEHHGPAIAGTPTHVGFGTELAELSIKRQLGGTIVKDWAADGLKVSIKLKASRLHREA